MASWAGWLSGLGWWSSVVPLGWVAGGGAGGAAGLLREGDPPSFRRLLARCLVGLPPDGHPPPPPPPGLSSPQYSSPQAVVERVVQRLCERGQENVLAFGYALPDEHRQPLPGQPGLCRLRPNSGTEELCHGLLWEMLLSRVGDRLLLYLLEHCALFMPGPPTTCYQICGRPVYQLTAGTTEPPTPGRRQKSFGPAHNLLTRYLRGRLLSRRRRRLGKLNGRQPKAAVRGPGPQEGGCSLASHSSPKSRPGTRLRDCLASRPPFTRRGAQEGLKRKQKECSERNAKRMKSTPVGQGSETGGAVSGRSARSCSEEGDSGTQTSAGPSWALETHRLVHHLALGAETSQNLPVNAEGGTCAHKVSPMPKITAEDVTTDKCHKKDSLNPAGESSDKTGGIKMRDLLYSSHPWKERLPQSFVLNQLKGSPAGGRKLLELILNDEVPEQRSDPNPPSCHQRKKRLPKRYRRLREELQELLQSHAKCPYPVLLRKYCPAWAPDKTGVRKQSESLSRARPGSAEEAPSGGLCPFPGTSSLSSRVGKHAELSQEANAAPALSDSSRADLLLLLKRNSSPWQVYSFVRGSLERVVPAALWGSPHNKKRFYRNVKKFLSLGKLDTFPLQKLLWRMRVNDCAWLHLAKGRGHSVPASEHHFRTHLLSKFLFWLMDSYVVQLLRSFFYITETEFQKNLLVFFRKAVWSQLQRLAVRRHLAKVQLLALSKEEVRALQQRKCVPLAAKLRFIPKVNGLRPVVRLNSLVGAGKSCRKNRDKKVQYFKMQLRNVYSVLKYELKKNPSLLGSSVFGKDDIYATWKKFVQKHLASSAQLPTFYFVKVSASKDFIPDMAPFVHHLQQSTSLRNAIVVEQGVYLEERCSDLFEFFLQLIHSNILKIENRYYVQSCGIPQGSILSTLLCSLCYGDMENKLLRSLLEDGVLMRLTDDFLLVTPHLAKAKTFLRTLARGVPEYGLAVNPAKMMMNFPLDEAGTIPGCSEFQQLPAHSMFPWCGFLIDTQTLEVYCDYSSYSCTSIKASLSFSGSGSAGAHMRNKLFVVLQLQCHGLFLDLQISSLRTVCINVYKIFLLQAFRFHACVLQLPFNQHIKNNPSFFLRIIADAALYGFSILKAKNAGIFCPAISPSVLLTFEALQWLCYQAFSVKLADHRAIYKCLLKPLKYCKMWLFRKIPEPTMQLLQEVTEPRLCEDFKGILD